MLTKTDNTIKGLSLVEGNYVFFTDGYVDDQITITVNAETRIVQRIYNHQTATTLNSYYDMRIANKYIVGQVCELSDHCDVYLSKQLRSVK